MLRTYERGWLPQDAVAGLVLSALLVPQGMAYAELAGVPAIYGLYTTVVCLVAYAVFGPSPFLVLGPDSALGAMIAAVILPLAAGSQDAAVAYASTLALMVGLLCTAAGVLKLGFVADLLSRPIRVGYLAGLAVTIVVGQLPKLFGFSVDADGLFAEIAAFWQNLGQTNVYALALGLIDLALIVGLKRMHSRIPGVLAAVVVSILAVVFFDLARRRAWTSSAHCRRASLLRACRVLSSRHCRYSWPRPWAFLWWRLATRLLPRPASRHGVAIRSTRIRSWPALAPPTCWLDCSRDSRSAPAARAPRWRSNPGPRRS